MSFILDALKKSELERQRQATPGFVEAPLAAKRRGLPVWAWVVGVLLVVNVGVLSVLLWRSQKPAAEPAPAASARHAAAPSRAAPVSAAPRDTEASAATASGTVGRSAEPAASPPGDSAAAADHFSPMDAASAGSPLYAPEIPVDDNPPRAAATTPRAVPPLAAAPRAQRRGDPTLTEPAEKPDSDEVLPTISELNLQGQQALPDIHLDVHVYATRPADRFVYVNMRKYHEGATLQEGPLLERIRRDGVVLNYRGVRFLLPRQ